MKFLSLAAITALWASAVQAGPVPVEVSAPQLMERQTTDYICSYGNAATWGQIVSPKAGTTYTFTRGESSGVTFEVIYCSTQYFKTRSLGLTIGFSSPSSATSNGQILALDYKPSNEPGVAPAGYYGYKFNVTVYPLAGSYPTGEQTLSAFETTTGYYNANNYYIKQVNLNFEVSG